MAAKTLKGDRFDENKNLRFAVQQREKSWGTKKPTKKNENKVE